MFLKHQLKKNIYIWITETQKIQISPFKISPATLQATWNMKYITAIIAFHFYYEQNVLLLLYFRAKTEKAELQMKVLKCIYLYFKLINYSYNSLYIPIVTV